jgi:hypothetical protein
MDHEVFKKIEAMEKQLEDLYQKLKPNMGYKTRVMELEQKLKTLLENSSREQAARSDAEKTQAAKLQELTAGAKLLEDNLKREKELRLKAADRLSALIQELEEEVKSE